MAEEAGQKWFSEDSQTKDENEIEYDEDVCPKKKGREEQTDRYGQRMQEKREKGRAREYYTFS